MRYEGNIYRPPSEARSLIIQVTVGCSHNKCRFCTMFKDKRFHIRAYEDIARDIDEMAVYYPQVGKIFLADGDALCLSNSKLLRILEHIREKFPGQPRIGIYGSAMDALRKTPAEMKDLKDAGVGIIYVGAESGSPKVLEYICKNGTSEEIVRGVRRIEEAGIKSSVTFISGMGGTALMKEHAEMSAAMLNAMSPSYASLLTLMIDPAAPMYADVESGRFTLLTSSQVLDETEIFLKNTDLKSPCVFRSNHASNYLVLAGDLPADKDRLLAEVREAKNDPELLRPEYFRAL